MEVKKNPEVAVERNSKLYFAIGLCLTLLFSWQMLEYKSYKVKVKPIEIISFEDSFEEALTKIDGLYVEVHDFEERGMMAENFNKISDKLKSFGKSVDKLQADCMLVY